MGSIGPIGEQVNVAVKSPENVVRAARKLPSGMICSRTSRRSLKTGPQRDAEVLKVRRSTIAVRRRPALRYSRTSFQLPAVISTALTRTGRSVTTTRPG